MSFKRGVELQFVQLHSINTSSFAQIKERFSMISTVEMFLQSTCAIQWTEMDLKIEVKLSIGLNFKSKEKITVSQFVWKD